MPRATLDFFAHQRAARWRTILLLGWFGLALIAVVALVYLGLVLPLVAASWPAPCAWHPKLLVGVAAAVLGTTSAGCVYHGLALARGGAEALAESLGARRVDPRSSLPAERRLLNVVEEMAIASGLPVPRIFLLEQEDGINALAAGSASGGAVVAVTAGTLEQLSRDELQAVVAHELSHVLNGDATLNARLMGLLGGLTIIDLFGREALRLAWAAGRSAWRAGVVLLPTGFVLAAAGWAGVLCGQLVRCGVSRQREYLADAAAAQLTRNPGALASALVKIRDHGSALHNARALEASHFFFANALQGTFERWLATHPPIEERIRRLEPGAGEHEVKVHAPKRPPATTAGTAAAPATLMDTIGAPQPAHLERAGELLATLPPPVVTAARDAQGARALLTALALAAPGDARNMLLGWLASRDAAAAARVVALAHAVDGLPREQRLVAVDLALASLDGLPIPQLSALAEDLAHLGDADGRPTVFDWMLQRLVTRGLERRLSGSRQPPVRYRAVCQVQVECLQLLSVIAWAGTLEPAKAQDALTAALRELGTGDGWRILPREKLGVPAVNSALRQLDMASPDLKRLLLRACTAAAVADARITSPEAELLRAVAASLGCPMPPALPGALSRARAVAL